MMEERKTGRIEYLDTARAYLILMVVLGHVLIVLNPHYDRLLLTAAQEFMSSFYMSGFFIIHGILLSNKSSINVPPWKTVLTARVRTMLVPYLFFEIVGLIFRWVLYGQPLPTGFYNLVTVRCNVGADWFLPALFMGNLLYTFWGMRQKSVVQAVSVCAGITLAMLLPGGQAGTILGRGLLAYSFITLGGLARGLFLWDKLVGLVPGAVSLTVTALCGIINLKWGGNDFYSCTVGNPLTLLLAGISGTCLVLFIARRFSCGLLRKAGAQTLIIMGTHQLVIYAMTAWFSAMRGGSILWGLVLLTSILVFEGPVVYILNRFFPLLLGRKRKNPVP